MTWTRSRLLLLISAPLWALILASPLALIWEAVRRAESRVPPGTFDSVLLTLWTSALALGIVVLFGIPLSAGLVRRTTATRLLDFLIDVPLVLPPAAAGISLLLLFGPDGWFGAPLQKLGIQIPFTSGAVVLAQVFVAAPLFMRPVIAALRTLPASFGEAAELDGAKFIQVMTVRTRAVAPAVVSGMALSWSRAVGEFGATLLLAGNLAGKTQTMSIAIYSAFEVDLGVAATLSTLLLGVSLLALGIIRVASRSALRA